MTALASIPALPEATLVGPLSAHLRHNQQDLQRPPDVDSSHSLRENSWDGIVTLPREERERTGADFQAAATTSRHVLIAAARNTRCD
jgi:hypothetical protein